MKGRLPAAHEWQPAPEAAMPPDASLSHSLLRSILREQQKTNTHLAALRHSLEQQVTLMSQMDDEIQTLKNDVAAERTAVDSAVALIQGFAQQLADAIAAAQAAGATPQQLSDLNDLHSAVSQQTQDLANAVATQSPPQSPPSP